MMHHFRQAIQEKAETTYPLWLDHSALNSLLFRYNDKYRRFERGPFIADYSPRLKTIFIYFDYAIFLLPFQGI